MRVIERVLDARNTVEGKIISILLSVLLVSSCFNVAIFTGVANAEEEEGIGGTDIENVVNDVPVTETVVESTPAPEKTTPVVEPVLADPADNNEGDESNVAPAGFFFEDQAGDKRDNDATATIDAAETSRVYVYLEIKGDTTGWTPSTHPGWYALGYFDAAGIGDPVGKAGDETDYDYSSYLSFDKIVRHEDNEKVDLDLSAVSWKKIHVSEGANNFGVDGKINTWHLDGEITIRNTYDVVFEAEGNGSVTNATKNQGIKHDTTEGIVGSQAVPESGYSFVGWYKGGVCVSEEPELSAEDVKANLNSLPKNDRVTYLDTTFTAKFVKNVTVTYDWKNKPAGIELPKLPESSTVASGETYVVDSTKYAPIKVYDQYGNETGTYTFEGWNSDDEITVTEDTIIYGTWSFESTVVAKHSVTYTWNLPDEKFYGLTGTEVPAPTVPASQEYVKGQKYTIDTTEYNTLYTHDEYGNINAEYIFEGWNPNGTYAMGDTDVEIEGTWNKTLREVSTWSIEYRWYKDDNAPAGVNPPSDDKKYINNEPYVVDTTFKTGTEATTVVTRDDYGNITGIYTFQGWYMPDGSRAQDGTITSDLTLDGRWSYESRGVKTHDVTYSWTGLPEETLYDAAGNVITPSVPEAIKGLVNNQPYKIDAGMPGTKVYTHDSYGNITAEYILGTWYDAHNGVMTDADHEVTASWISTPVGVKHYLVGYAYEGAVPSSAAELPADRAVALNQPVSIADEPSAEGWMFEGWTLPEGVSASNNQFSLAAMPEGNKVVLVGKWVAKDTDAISVDNVNVEYDGKEHRLTVKGTQDGDEVRFETANGGEFSNNAINVTDEAVIVKVYRDGVLIKTLETTVKITPAPLNVVIFGASANAVYNGTMQGVEGYVYEASTADRALPEGVELKLVRALPAAAQGTNVGAYTMGLNGTSFMFTGENARNYKITQTVVDGQIRISPAPVIVTAYAEGTGTKVAGEADPRFLADVRGTFNNDQIAYTVSRVAGEAVGTYAVYATGAAQQGNYAITYVPGVFTITEATPTPTVPAGVTPVPPVVPGPGVPADGPAPAVPAGEVIADDGVPMAQTPEGDQPAEGEGEEETIEDDATPMSAYDAPECWVHILMIIGIVLTAVYGLCVVLRRLGYRNQIEQIAKNSTGSRRRSTSTAASGAHANLA